MRRESNSRSAVMVIEDPYADLSPMYSPYIKPKKGNKEHETRLKNRRKRKKRNKNR